MTGTDRRNDTMRPNLLTMQTSDKSGGQGEKKLLSIEDGSDDPLNGISTYILRQIWRCLKKLKELSEKMSD